jgi:hypothetical protein
MIDPELDISNLDFPVAAVIREALSGLSLEKRQELLSAQSENEFIPTSRARFSDLAVLRFIKLIQASSTTKTPIIPKSHTYWMSPPDRIPFSQEDRRCQSFIG